MKINIGNSEYNLISQKTEEISQKIEALDAGFIGLGYCDDMNKEIAVSSEVPSVAKKETLFHELTHAFLSETGDEELYYDERFVSALSKQIYGFFARNNLEKIYRFLKIE